MATKNRKPTDNTITNDKFGFPHTDVSDALPAGCDDGGFRNRQTVERNTLPPDDGRIR